MTVKYLMNFSVQDWGLEGPKAKEAAIVLNTALRRLVNRENDREYVREQMMELMWSMRHWEAHCLAQLSFLSDKLDEIFGEPK